MRNYTIIRYKGKSIKKFLGSARNSYQYAIIGSDKIFSSLAEVKEYINTIRKECKS